MLKRLRPTIKVVAEWIIVLHHVRLKKGWKWLLSVVISSNTIALFTELFTVLNCNTYIVALIKRTRGNHTK